MAVALRFILVALAVVASPALIIGIVIWQTSDDDTGPDAGTSNATVFIVNSSLLSSIFIHLKHMCSEWKDTRKVWPR